MTVRGTLCKDHLTSMLTSVTTEEQGIDARADIQHSHVENRS